MAKVVNVIHGTGNLKHNNRDKDSLSKNIDIDRIENNKILVKKDIKKFIKNSLEKQLKNIILNKREKIEK